MLILYSVLSKLALHFISFKLIFKEDIQKNETVKKNPHCTEAKHTDSAQDTFMIFYSLS